MRKKTLLAATAAVLSVALAAVFFYLPIGGGFSPPETAVRTPEIAAPPPPLSINHVADKAEHYHRKEIRVEGTISSRVKMKRFKGKDYTVFKMKNSEKGATMLVYLRGSHKNLNKNNRLIINGRFYKKKRYLFIKLKNVLKGKTFEVLS